MDLFEYLADGGIDMEAFRAAMQMPPAVSFKVNRRKAWLRGEPGASDLEMIGYGEELEPVKWCRSGFYLDERPKFTLNPLLHAGMFYVQDASSMVYETIVYRMLFDENTPYEIAVADLCAAPGGKSTSILNSFASQWDRSYLLLANEFMPKRAQILRENILKWGDPNVIVTNDNTRNISKLRDKFYIVAVDAPCSGEGMMRKDEDAVNQWSPRLVEQCSALQREILDDAVELLMPGGYLIYSTCTFNKHEDEEQVLYLMDKYGLECVDLHFPDDWNIGKSLCPEVTAYRFMPHLTRGEGLFVAVLRKPGHPYGINLQKLAKKISGKLNVISHGYPTSELKGKIIPAPEAPLNVDFDTESYPIVNLSLDEALAYLRGDAIVLPEQTPTGYVVVAYKNVPLGFVKNIGNRANNLYPKYWRIRN